MSNPPILRYVAHTGPTKVDDIKTRGTERAYFAKSDIFSLSSYQDQGNSLVVDVRVEVVFCESLSAYRDLIQIAVVQQIL